MGKINIPRVVLGGLVTAAAFIVVEMIVEGAVRLISGFEEGQLLAEAYGVSLGGARFHIVNIGYFIVMCMLIIWVYAAIRPKFGPGPKTALITSAVFLLYFLLLGINLVNLGILPGKIGLISLAFNIVELPIAVLAGAFVYRE
jgi:hypothetical protein